MANYSEFGYADKLKYKAREVNTLRNRVQRYKKKLLKEAFTIAKEKGIEIYLNNIENITSSVIILKKDQEGNINTDPIIELSRKNLPSLYRRYHESKTRFDQEYTKLEDMVAQAA